jgi:hypothetical protein
MAHFLLSLIFGWIMYQCYLHQPRYNTQFAVLSAAFFGLAGLAAAKREIPQVFRHPLGNALGRAICEKNPHPSGTCKRLRLALDASKLLAGLTRST